MKNLRLIHLCTAFLDACTRVSAQYRPEPDTALAQAETTPLLIGSDSTIVSDASIEQILPPHIVIHPRNGVNV